MQKTWVKTKWEIWVWKQQWDKLQDTNKKRKVWGKIHISSNYKNIDKTIYSLHFEIPLLSAQGGKRWRINDGEKNRALNMPEDNKDKKHTKK